MTDREDRNKDWQTQRVQNIPPGRGYLHLNKRTKDTQPDMTGILRCLHCAKMTSLAGYTSSMRENYLVIQQGQPLRHEEVPYSPTFEEKET